MHTLSSPSRTLSALFLAAALAACGDSSGSSVQVPARLDVVAGDGQSGAAGAELPTPLAVRVVDEDGKPVRDRIVNFRVTAGGGSVFAGSAITDRDGVARERWTLGTVAADSQKVEVRAVDNATGAALVFAVFRADALPAAPSALAPAGGASKTGFAGETVADSPAVRVVDAYGNPVAGVAVAWTAGGGSAVSAASVATGPDGVARVGWTLPPRVGGGATATATSGALGSAAFTATAALPPTAVLERVSADSVTARTGPSPTPLVVRVRLADGRLVEGAAVGWTGASITETVLTDSAGRSTHIARFNRLGLNTVTAEVPGLAPVAFRVHVLPGPPFRLESEPFDPSPVHYGVGEYVSFRVTLLDAAFNPVAGEPVTFSVTQGGGTLESGTVATNASGVAWPDWRLGATEGEHVLVASHPDATNTVTVRVNAQGTGPADRVEVDPDTLRLSVGQSGRIEVEAYDIAGNRVPDQYNFTVKSTMWRWTATGPVTLDCAKDAFMGNPTPNFCIVTATAAGTARVTARNEYKAGRATGTTVVIIQ